MKFGYARVSTEKQSLDLQLDALHKAGAKRVFKEKITGTKRDRPALEELMKYLREGDILIVYKLDRLARSTKHMLEIADELDSRGVELISIQDNVDTSSAVGKAMFRMLAVLSEMERDILSERTRAGLESAKRRGKTGGRPKKATSKVQQAFRLYDSGDYSITEIVEMTGISKATLYRKLKERKDEVTA